MSARFDLLAQQLLGQPDVAACSLDEIQRLAERHPYFAPARLLLLRKLRETGSPDYGSALQKAVLHYPDPLAFEYLLQSDELRTSWEAPLPPAPDERAPEAEAAPESTVPSELPTAAELDTTPTTHLVHEPETANLDLQTAAVAGALPMEDAGTPGAELDETEKKPAPTEVPTPSGIPAPETGAGGLSFEPFHTVDYFASQGIRLSAEEVPKDKFGKQLKSFTEWLRSMKRLPAAEVAEAVDPGSERKVATLAAGSVHDAEIVTEAMAEVWVKQGNRDKAAQVYRKLSLLHPAKSAYFAAKLELLKRP